MTTVLVASGGGHLQQLHELVPRLGLGSDVVWVTPRSGLSEDLLRGEQSIEIPYSLPRDWRAACRLTAEARRMLSDLRATRVISTGASPAPPFFLAGARLGLDLHYIESATRSMGPSMSGRLVAKLPSATLYTQYPSWASDRWHYGGSVFDPFSAAPIGAAGSALRRVVVTLGTEGFSFRRAVEHLLRVLPKGVEVLWQTGHTNVEGLPITGHSRIPGNELRAAMAEADLVISHAGTGTALTTFELGKAPLLLPRSAQHGEHIDDHQKLTASELSRRGLAVSTPVEALTEEHLDLARRIRVVQDPILRPFHLVETESRTKPRIIDLTSRRRASVDTHLTGDVVIDLRTPQAAATRHHAPSPREPRSGPTSSVGA